MAGLGWPGARGVGGGLALSCEPDCIGTPDRRLRVELPRESFFGTFNLQSLGVALAVAWFGAMLWSPCVIPPRLFGAEFDFHMHMLRLILLLGVCIVYAGVGVASTIMGSRMSRVVLVALGACGSPFAVLEGLIPGVGLLCAAHPALSAVFWLCAGCSAAAMMLLWGYDRQTKPNYGQGVVNIASASIISGVVFILLSVLERPVAAMAVLCLPFVLLAMLLARMRWNPKRGSAEESRKESSAVLTSVKMALGGGATPFVLSCGLVMGLAGSLGTQFSLAEQSPVFIGASSVLAGIVMLVVLGSKRVRPNRTLFALFLPFAVVCLLLFSMVNESGRAVPLFAVFFVMNACNVLNTAYGEVGFQRQVPDASLGMLKAEGRLADMVGSFFGWAAGSFTQFAVADQWVPYCYFFIAVVLVGVAVAFAVAGPQGAGGRFLQEGGEARADRSFFFQEWEFVCMGIADKGRLSAREREIFVLLSRGRDRQYIHETLGVSPSTVRTHTYNLYRKLGVHTQQQLIDVVEKEFISGA